MGRIYRAGFGGAGILLVLVAVWAGLKIFVLGYFPVPTGSMRPSIIPGDVVFVNKLRLGPRTFRGLDFLDSDTIPVKNVRFPGYGDVRRNDVIVFNYPYADSWSRARFNYKKFRNYPLLACEYGIRKKDGRDV